MRWRLAELQSNPEHKPGLAAALVPKVEASIEIIFESFFLLRDVWLKQHGFILNWGTDNLFVRNNEFRFNFQLSHVGILGKLGTFYQLKGAVNAPQLKERGKVFFIYCLLGFDSFLFSILACVELLALGIFIWKRTEDFILLVGRKTQTWSSVVRFPECHHDNFMEVTKWLPKLGRGTWLDLLGLLNAVSILYSVNIMDQNISSEISLSIILPHIPIWDTPSKFRAVKDILWRERPFNKCFFFWINPTA